ncbi:GntR family transcriptional regulator [Actinomycetospora rhizophila]|uniref:GntR family transcriptional regulator n=1 Tax=Actinomycetospora rhizophila TaxID=1416876 RepID=A0ABV9ZLP8_9PSEU
MALEAAKSQYRQVADLLREGIERQDYAPGSTLPAESELAAEYGVSRVTINRAVQLLRGEGLVRVLRGRGTVVRAIPPIRRNSSRRYARTAREEDGSRGAFDFEIRRLGLKPSTKLAQLGQVAPPETARDVLGLEVGEMVLIRKREMFASDEPVLLATSYFPWDLAEQAGVTDVDTGPGGTYSRLAEIGKGPVRFTEDVRVRTPTAAEERFFALSETQQVYEIVHIAYLEDGTAVEYREDVLPTYQWIMHFEWNAENGNGDQEAQH